MRLADIILSQGLNPPPLRDGKNRSREKFREITAEWMDLTLAKAPVVEATNVYEYCKNIDRGIDLYDLPCAAPPMPLLFVEYQQHNGKPIGLLGWADDGPFNVESRAEEERTPSLPTGQNGFIRLTTDEGTSSHLWLSDNLPDQQAWDRVRWVWDLEVFQGHGRRAYGPLATVQAALDQWGRLIDVTYELFIPGDSDLVEALSMHPFHIFITTLNFMQCANVHTEYVTPSPALSKKHRKKGHTNRDLVRYHVLKLDPVGPDQRNRSRSTGQGPQVGFHIVRGEFHHYGDCCPGHHPPKGKLFGKHTGIYWVPMHSRGNPERGSIVTDFQIKPVNPSP